MIIETIDFYLKNSCSRAIFYKNQYFFMRSNKNGEKYRFTKSEQS